jgi:hypothetical protein
MQLEQMLAFAEATTRFISFVQRTRAAGVTYF